MQELGAMETILEEVEERYILCLSFECNEGFLLLQKEIFKDLINCLLYGLIWFWCFKSENSASVFVNVCHLSHLVYT